MSKKTLFIKEQTIYKIDSIEKLELYQDDTEKRVSYYKIMDEILMTEFPVIPLYYDQAVRFSRKNIRGLEMNSINLLNLKRVSKD